MSLDVNTLFVVTIYVEAILGLLLLFAWAQNTAIHAVCWWGFAHLIRAASVMLFGMYGTVPDLITIDLANALLFTAFAVTWTGARVFDGRPVEPVYLVTGAVVWLLVCRLPVLSDAINTRALVASGIITTYTWLTAYEFWRGRSEQLGSRWPAIFMLFAHGALYLLRTPLVAMLPWSPSDASMYGSVWLTVLSFEALLFTISVAFILLAMAKERTELRHRTAAMVDPLTGIANRRAFLQEAEELTKRHLAKPRPTAVLLIDLDNFKSINDRFGHALGDRVLEVFTEAARQSFRVSDLIGRLGGEEFAAIMYGVSCDEAVATAERLRERFAQAAQEVDGRPVCATVSIGVVVCQEAALDVPEHLAQADQALYFAKENGRNRVEVASLEAFVARGSEDARTSVGAAGLATKSAA
ncbi:GGDEF domain-containing protein [Pseudolabrys taiwanensis]|uniref:diguanylate cyclase n=1 Tax=Pseudolabrys taiwanensis TaxID=331696 RepID=A0A345ZSB0_9HYPH|nr:GGDEF domain-containing protein [Pseudolabrys taiwanensis]AXK79807.1 GGDEF domain-containing protein [Pseudolabrys taiwanensis]